MVSSLMRGKTPEVDGLKAGQSVGAFGTAADSDRYPYWHQYGQVFISKERFRSIGQMGEGEKKLRIDLGGKGGKGRHVKSSGGAAGAGQLGKRIGEPASRILCFARTQMTPTISRMIRNLWKNIPGLTLMSRGLSSHRK
jgi:hypothetical protein